MEIKYFKTFQLNVAIGLFICDENRLKNEYRRLAQKLHPDKGGNAEEFKAMMNEYEYILSNLAWFRSTIDDLRTELEKQPNVKEKKPIYQSKDVLAIAKAQKDIIVYIVFLLPISILREYLDTFLGIYPLLLSVFNLLLSIFVLLLIIFVMIKTYKLAFALNKRFPSLWAICGGIPFGFIVLMFLSRNATKEIREKGFHVGFWGVNIREMKNKIYGGDDTK
jgi:hypothetical protein